MHPIEHNFRRSVPPGGNIAGHLILGRSCQPKIKDLKLAVLVDGDIGWLQVLRNKIGTIRRTPASTKVSLVFLPDE